MSFDLYERIGLVGDGEATCLEAAELAAYLLNVRSGRNGLMGDLVAWCIDNDWVVMDPDGVDWLVNPEIDWQFLEDEREWT